MAEPTTMRWREDPPALSPEMRGSLRTRRRVLLLLAILLVFAGILALMMFAVRPVPHVHFVPLWITEYQSPALPQRLVAERDRDAFREGRYFAQPIPPDEASPETQALQQRLAALRSLPAHEPVVFYLSAHAHTVGKEAYLLAADADPVPARSRVPLSDVLEALTTCPARQKLLILDLMNPLTDARLGLLANDIPVPPPGSGLLILTSCSPGQTALHSEDQQRSVFSYYVEQGLRGTADGFNTSADRNGQVSARELGEFVKARVERWAWRNQRVKQTPLLLGDGDFPILPLEQRQVKPPLPLPEAEKYPSWLADGWKVRQKWHDDESYRLTPQLFRQLEATLLAAERDWRQGANAERVRDTLKAQLVRFEQKLKKANVAPLAKAPSLMLEAKGCVPNEEVVARIESETAPIKTRSRFVAEKEGVKLPPDLIPAMEKTPTFDVLLATFEAAANDPTPHPDRIRLFNLLIQSRQPEPQYAETLFLERLGELADQTGSERWPADTVKQALDVMRLGERIASQPRVFPWIREPLEEAAQHRYEGELLLLAGTGYAPPGEASRRFQAAAERYEAAQRRGDTVLALLRLLDEAFAFLPAYAGYLERQPDQESTWLDAIEACGVLADLLANAPADLSGAAQPMTQLEDNLRRLREPFTADALAALQTRLRRNSAPPTLLNEAEAILATPFLSADDREALWKTTRALGRRLHEETRQLDQADVNQKPQLLEVVRDDTDPKRLDPQEGQRALRRARMSLALLRLGGLPPDEADKLKLDAYWVAASAKIAGDDGRTALAALGDALRRAWTRRVPELLTPGLDLVRRDRLSLVYLPFDPAILVQDSAPMPRTEVHAHHQRALYTWRADRNRYEARQLAALGLLSERGTRFYSRAGSAYQSQADVLPRDPACQIGSDTPTVRLTPQTTRATATLSFRGFPATATEGVLPVRVLLPDTNWLQVTPGLPNALDLGSDTLLHLPQGETSTTLPLTFRVKPNAEGVAPQGLFIETMCGRRTVHYRLPVSLDAVSERIEILLSVNPREPGEPLDELRLRPIKARQPFFLYLRNPSEKPRKLLVQLAGGQGNLPGGEAKIDLAPKETKPVRFTPAATPAPPAAPEAVLPELSGDLQVRLLDLDGGNRLIDVRSYRVRIASAADYTKVTSIQFTPPSPRDRGLGSGQNRLSVTIETTPGFTGPACPVELILPPARIPGFLGAKSGTLRGELTPGTPLTLYADNLQFTDGVSEDGHIHLAVDGDERAYVFRTTFARLGDPTSPREDALPALRIATRRFAATGAAPGVTLEVDRPPDGATVDLSVGRYQEGTFEPESVAKRPTAKRQRIACSPISPDGAILFEASVGDWVIQPETGKVVGPRVLRARLLDKEGAPIRTVFETLTLDNAAPQGIRFVDAPKLAKKDAPLTLKATAGASVSGVSEVFFFLGKDVQGKPPQGAALVPGKPLDDAKTLWTATLPLRGDKTGPTEFTVQFVNRAAQSSFATTAIELIDADPATVLPGRLEGSVVEGAIPQSGLTVSLRDEKNVEKQTTKTKEDGTFVFEKVTPGKYILFAIRPVTKRQGSTTASVTAEQTTTVPPIRLFKP